MTTREFLNAVIGMESVSDEMVEKANAMLVALDNRNISRSSKPTKTQLANEPIKVAIAEILKGASEPLTSPQITELLNDETISHNKVTALLKQIDGVVVSEIKVPKKGKMKAYEMER